jgi:uncharacterized repeat protein (TIGR01451 family)
VKLTVSNVAIISLALFAATGGLAAQAAVAAVAKSPAGPSHPAATPTATRHLPAVPGLTISVSDGHDRVRPGERLGYTLRVTNGGAMAAHRLKITLMLPAYLRFISASREASPVKGKVVWPVNLRPGQTASFLVRAELARTPPGLTSVAAVACASSGTGRTLVCAAHLDALPGTSPAKSAGSNPPATGHADRPGSGLATKVIIAVTVIAVLLTLAAVGARRSKPRGQRLRHRHSG